jgi:hypothetical protein
MYVSLKQKRRWGLFPNFQWDQHMRITSLVPFEDFQNPCHGNLRQTRVVKRGLSGFAL